MNIEELEYKERVLRECFKEKLKHLNVEGANEVNTIKCIKTYGILWHLTHQLLKAEHEEQVKNKTGAETTAETIDIQATGLKMIGSK